ncbi:MAG: TDT family transporter [Rhodomicrobium sp.]
MSPVTVAARPMLCPAKGLARTVCQFTPNWFTVTMGTGVLALVLNQFPIPIQDLHQGLQQASQWLAPDILEWLDGAVGQIHQGLHEAGRVLWLLNIGLFTLFSLLYAARWVFFFSGAQRVFQHSVASMFFGAIPMGLATIINGFLTFGVPLWGDVAVSIAQPLWWVDVALSVASGLLVPFLMFTRQDHSMEKMTAVWLIPIVAAEVAAASGGILIPHLPDAEAFNVLIISYALWAFSVPLAMSILVILLMRLILHKLPDRDMAASGWLSLGPIGTGALGLILLGGDAPRTFASAGIPMAGGVAFGIGIIGGTVFWGYGVWWLMLAVLKMVRYVRLGMPFNLGWWGFTFPLGVYTLATLALARVTHLELFSIAGGLLAICLAGFWVLVAARTIHGAWFGYLFVAPCLPQGAIPDRFEADIV